MEDEHSRPWALGQKMLLAIRDCALPLSLPFTQWSEGIMVKLCPSVCYVLFIDCMSCCK